MKNHYSQKRLLKSISLSLVFAAFAGNSIAQPTPTVLHYKFEETGTTVTNLATSPPPGTATATIMGGLTQGPDGQCGNALIGTGNSSSTDYLNTGWAPNLGTGSWTISMYTKDITPSSTLFYIFGDAGTGSFRCFTNGVAGPDNWILRGAGLTDIYVNGGATVAPHLTTFVYDNVANAVYGYLDGVLVTTVLQGTPNVSGTGPFKVVGYSSNVGAPSGGKIDEFRVYDYALSASEVMELMSIYNTGSIAPSVCASYTTPSGNDTYTTSGIYYDTVINPTGCDTIYTIDLTIIDPVVSANASQNSICDGDQVTLYGTGSNSGYSWDNGVSDSVAFTPTGTVTYIVNAIDTNGCFGADTIDVIVNPLPAVVGTASPSSVCEGDPVTLTGSGADTYAWTGGVTDGVAFNPTATGTYTLTGTDVNGCSNTADVDVTVNVATSSTLNETATGSYTLNGQTYTQSGTYTQVITNAAGCDSTITLVLTISGAGLNELSASFSVYPNPANDYLTITSSLAIQTTLRLTDVQGRLVKEIKMNGTEEIIALTDLETGTYLLFIGDSREALKILKQ